MNEQRKYQVGKLAMLFPDMQKSEYAAFKADIAKNGLLEPIYIHQGEVIDGRHRLLACEELGIEPRYESIDNIDPLKFVWSKNLHRRTMSQSQKALAIVLLTEWPKRGRPKNNPANLPDYPTLDRNELAAKDRVRPRLINDAAALVHPDSGAVPELIDAAKQGIVSVTDARKVKEESRKVQRRAVDLKTRRKVKTIKAGVDLAKEENAPKKRRNKEPDVPLWLDREGWTLCQLDLPGLRDCVDTATVDAIIAVPPDDPCPNWYSDLAGLAADALTDEGVLVVPAGGELMKEAIIHLNQEKLSLVCSIGLQFPGAVCPPVEPHWLEATQIPLLVYGMPGYRLGGGSDVIAVPRLDGRWDSWCQALDAAMEPVVRRFATEGKVVLNPELNGRSGVALAARTTGCTFIGADLDGSRLQSLADELGSLERPGPLPSGIVAGEPACAPRGDGDGFTPQAPEAVDADPERPAGVAGQDGPEPGEVSFSHIADGFGAPPTDSEAHFLDKESSPEDGDRSFSWPDSDGRAMVSSASYEKAPSPRHPTLADTKADDGACGSSAYSTRPEPVLARTLTPTANNAAPPGRRRMRRHPTLAMRTPAHYMTLARLRQRPENRESPPSSTMAIHPTR